MGLDSVVQGGGGDGMERGWKWYNLVGWVGFRITKKVSY